MPGNAAEGARDLAEVGPHVRGADHRAADGPRQKADDPARNHRVAGGDGEAGEDGNDARVLHRALSVQGLFHSAHGAGLRPAAEAGLAHHAGAGQNHNAEQVGNQERRAAELRDAIGERPDVRHTDGRADGGHNKAQPV